jgi:uncharacterized membrane protein
MLNVGVDRVPAGDAAARRVRRAPAAYDGVDSVWSDGAWIVLSAIMLVALALRVVSLGSELWLDEMYAMDLALRSPFVDLLTVYKGDNQHPLFSLLSHLSIVSFGETPWAARLPALLFGVACVPMVYALGARFEGRREALLASALLAVSYHHVWFSQNARGYTMLAFWTLAMTLLLLRGIRERRPALFVLYGVTGALGVYTHLTVVFLIAGHALVCAWMAWTPFPRERLDWRLPLLAFGTAGMGALLLHGPMLGQVIDWFLHRPSRLAGVSTPGWALAEAFRVLGTGVGAAAVLGGGAIFALGLSSYARRSPLVAALVVVPVITMVVGALAARGTMYPRFFFLLIGLALLIVVRGAFAASHWLAAALSPGAAQQRTAMALGTVVAVLMIGVSVFSLRVNYAYPKQGYLAAAAYVESHTTTGEPIAVINTSGYVYVDYYRKPWTRITGAEELAALRARGASVWLVYSFPRYLERQAAGVLTTIRSECPDAARFHGTVGDGDVFACRLPARAAAITAE